VAFSVALGPLFDVYLYQLAGGSGQGNVLVGEVESVSGLVALALVIPVGVIVDTWNRVRLMQLASLCGILSSVLGAFAIIKGNVPFWYATMVVNGVYVQLGNSVCYALFADSISPNQRPRATSIMGIVSNVAQAVGPAMTFLSMLYLGNNWSMAALQSVLMFGMVVLNPICCILMLFFEKAPFETGGEGEEEKEINETELPSNQTVTEADIDLD